MSERRGTSDRNTEPSHGFRKEKYICWGVGFCLVIAGLIAAMLGATGSMELIVEGQGCVAHITNASPGIVAMILGTLVLILACRKREEIIEIVHKGGTIIKRYYRRISSRDKRQR